MAEFHENKNEQFFIKEFEKQRRELTESLKYASYIQNALLPDSSYISHLLPEHFILYKPRDIVSGDFYWITRIGNKILMAVADCTGHGVPGAFMSILGITFLSEIIRTTTVNSASNVLNRLREYIMKALNQQGREHEPKDGIDMSFCILSPETNVLDFAGAFNPLYVVKRDKGLVEIQGDKMPIGIAALEEISFTNHQVELHDGDMVYLFSDGYPDQFGGPEGKKFKYQPFRNMLLDLSKLSMEKQREHLIEEFDKWRGKHPQLDDIIIFGFRYHTLNNSV